MDIETRLTFDREEIKAIMFQEYIRIMGPIPEGYALHGEDHYGDYRVELYKKPEPKPAPIAAESAECTASTTRLEA